MKTKKILYTIGGVFLAGATIITLSDISTYFLAKENIISECKDIPETKVGLVLGTGKYLPDGETQNLFYINRINAAYTLYKNGKIKKIIVSGDNSEKDYDEATDMENDLIEKGVKKEDIYKDYAGFRTLDSVVRAKEIFSVDDMVIISQKFHLERAIILAKFHKITAKGYPAKDVPVSISPRVWLRERLARVKMWIDIAIGKKPKFLGEKIDIS